MSAPSGFFRAIAAAFALALAGSLGTAASAETPLPEVGYPVVVELFTSQGCSSCPPADALLRELAGLPNVIALSLHVDYWDYIGWEDPFASPFFTERQRNYTSSLHERFPYTPQMVIDGERQVVGSRRGQVLQAIAEEGREPKTLALEFDPRDGTVKIPAGPAPPAEGASIWLAAFDGYHETTVERGENSGRRLANANVVREFVKLGTWSGEAMAVPLDLAGAAAAGREGCAVIVQEGLAGPVLGALMMRVPRG